MWNAGHTTLNDTVFHKNTGYDGRPAWEFKMEVARP